MDTITKEKILEQCLSKVQEMAKSQYLTIDNDYYLLDNYRWNDVHFSTYVNEHITLSHNEDIPIKPDFQFTELNRGIILLKINYKRTSGDIKFEMVIPTL